MSKLSWWLIGSTVLLFALYLITLLAVENTRYASPSTTVGMADVMSRVIFSRVDAVRDAIWPRRYRSIPQSPVVRETHAIGLAMWSYANDNGGKYPTGKSSTEVFQKLVDGEYVTDPRIFYAETLRLPGKRPATSKKLKPENVCWDVTIPVDTKKTDPSLPLLFTTGFKMIYAPGGSAVPYPAKSPATRDGIALFFVNNSAAFITSRGPDEIVPLVISTSFKANGETYVQLSPDGPVP